jgi:serine-type D-Ala-D-Ala carboxypeptidase (penicillin-binding protein 5/6)
MPSSHHRRRLLAVAAVITGLTLGSADFAHAAPLPKKKFVAPQAKSWVGGKELIGTKLLVDLPAGVKPPPAPKAVSYLIADLDSREIIAAKNVHVPLAPASTLKVFTSLALAPELDREQVYTGTFEDANIDGTRVGVVEGSRYTVDDLLHGLLMSSGNDCAHALGNLVGGNAAATELMRAKANQLGAFDTVIRNTSGLDAKGQVSSAYDLALAGAAALQDKQLAKIMVTPSYAFPDQGKALGGKRKRYQTQNHNRLLGYTPGVTGIKNGYTSKALGSNVASATYQGHSYIAVVMRVDGPVFTPTGELLEWAFKNGQKAGSVGTLVKPGEMSAMTGPGIIDTTDESNSLAAAPEPSATAGDLSAALLKFWPVVAVATLLMGAVVLGLRPVLANSRRSRARKMRARQQRSRRRH